MDWSDGNRLHRRGRRRSVVMGGARVLQLFRDASGSHTIGGRGRRRHRRRALVAKFIRAQRGRLAIERLPAYAPELNPVEYIWGYWKHHELPNFCPRDFGQLSYQARRALRRMRRHPRLVRSFRQQANLSL